MQHLKQQDLSALRKYETLSFDFDITNSIFKNITNISAMFEPLLCYIEANKTENLFIQDEKSTGSDHSVFFLC